MSIENRIKSAREKYPDIMASIANILGQNGVTFQSQHNGIIIKERSTKEVLRIIYSLPIDAETLFILVDVVTMRESIYIRKKESI